MMLPITYLLRWHELLVVGEGNTIYFYDSDQENRELRAVRVFKSQHIHGIDFIVQDSRLIFLTFGGDCMRCIALLLASSEDADDRFVHSWSAFSRY